MHHHDRISELISVAIWLKLLVLPCPPLPPFVAICIAACLFILSSLFCPIVVSFGGFVALVSVFGCGLRLFLVDSV